MPGTFGREFSRSAWIFPEAPGTFGPKWLRQSGPEEIRELILKEQALDWIEQEDEILMRDLLTWMSLVLLPERRPDTPVPGFDSLAELKTFMEKDMETWSDILLNKGRAEGEAILLLRLMESKYGPVAEAVKTQVRNADTGRLEEWAERILTAEQLDEVFGPPGNGH